MVCQDCAFKLDQVYDFREKCLHTEGLFMEMLKEIGKEGVVHISEHDLASVNNIGAIQRNLNNIQMNNEDIQNHSVVAHETTESAIHTMQVLDEIDLAGGEQVVSQEEIGQQDTDIQATGISCLDGDTVRIVDEHMREVIEPVYFCYNKFSNLCVHFLILNHLIILLIELLYLHICM